MLKLCWLHLLSRLSDALIQPTIYHVQIIAMLMLQNYLTLLTHIDFNKVGYIPLSQMVMLHSDSTSKDAMRTLLPIAWLYAAMASVDIYNEK